MTENYKIIKNAISNELSEFCLNYFLIKRQVASYLIENKHLPPFANYFGTWDDSQVPNTYSHYADIVMETLLLKVKPVMEKETGLKLIETYSYARIYKKGDELKRHKDRFSCEISTTLNFGGNPWPIFIEPSGEMNKEGVKIILNPGDMLVYKGCMCEHWREPFDGDVCAQVFLHYNNASSEEALKNKFDSRPFIGLPSKFKRSV
jgi:hypothetical protein